MSKTDPKNEILIFFAYAIFEKLQNEVQNFGVGYLPEKRKILKKLILHRKSVFDTEKYGHKIFSKFELFGFLRN